MQGYKFVLESFDRERFEDLQNLIQKILDQGFVDADLAVDLAGYGDAIFNLARLVAAHELKSEETSSQTAH